MDVTTEPPVGVLATPVITPRPLADYRNMFLLTDEELLAGPILDCPAGSSPFGAQVRRRGGTVVSVDPVYARPRTELVDQLAADLAMLRPRVLTNRANMDWSYLGSPDALMRTWELATDLFLADYDLDGERYVAAALPSLPFPDKHFRLALSSHLLFVYPEYLSVDQHVAGLLELVRVTDGEVRVFPLVDYAGVAYSPLAEVRAALAGHGVRTEIRMAACTYSVGPRGPEMLVCRREG